MKIYKSIILLIFSSVLLNAQVIISDFSNIEDLGTQIRSTFQQNKSKEKFWIGYSIQRDDNYKIIVGSFYLHKENQTSLTDLLNGKIDFNDYVQKAEGLKGIRISGRSINLSHINWIDDRKEEEPGETAILIRYDRSSTDVNDLAEIVICPLLYYVDLQSYPLYWIGKSRSDMSADYLIKSYNSSDNWYVREELVSAIGVHKSNGKVTSFLINEFYESEKKNFREDILFWIGVQNNETALNALMKIIDEETIEFGEEAVMALSVIDSENALNELIKIARQNSNKNLREHALFGLGNKAVEKAESVLKDVVENDPDTELKKTAIYALANNGEKYVDYLINIAKNHSNLTLRKTAIYSLSNLEDKRAAEALIELAKGN